jgi:type I restriction enzyme S subunit
LELEDLKFCAESPELERLLLADGDLLFNRTNSPELVGKCAVFRGSRRMSFASYLIRVRFDPAVADPEFVNLWINSSFGRYWASLVKTDGVSQSNINGTKLASMPLPLPPLPEQNEIVRQTTAISVLADSLVARIDRVEGTVDRLYRTFQSSALCGKLGAIEDIVAR